MSTYFCGEGGYSSECDHACTSQVNQKRRHKKKRKLKNKTKSCGKEGGEFGGGAVGHEGGSGGGGGFSCGMIYEDSYPGDRVVDVIVGRGGVPSSALAGSGMVLVTWGLGDACDLTIEKLKLHDLL